MLNVNSAHNLLNVIGAIVGVLIMTDWTAFGMDAATAAKVAAGTLLAQNLIKVVMNITRDGVTGLVKEQPPVEK